MTGHTVTYRRLGDILPADVNPKGHDVDGIARSITTFGFATPGLLDERTGRLVAGHGRHQALAQLKTANPQTPPAGIGLDGDGEWLVPVITGWSSNNDAEAAAYLLADNRWTELGGWHEQDLHQLLLDLAQQPGDLAEVAGFDQQALDDLLASINDQSDDDLLASINDQSDDDDGDGSGEGGEGELLTWPMIQFAAPPSIRTAWQAHIEDTGLEEYEALNRLLKAVAP